MNEIALKVWCILLGFWFSITFSFGQTAPEEYYSLVREADSLYKARSYFNSGLKYSAAFQTFGGLGYSDNRYDAACSWALAGNADSAFYNLQRIVDNANFANFEHITTDADLLSLHADRRWEPLIEQVKQNKERSEEKYDKRLLQVLDSLRTEDQKWRKYRRRFINGELQDDTISKEFITRQMLLTDSLNYFQLKAIFDKYGFPNYDIVGPGGANSFWLLVQHQDRRPDFQVLVLEKMKIEVEANKASRVDYAYLVDRVKINAGQQQVYGTQMELNSDQTSFEPKNVIDPEDLNERRASVGLGTIESYIELMNTLSSGALKKTDE
jgi:hypothetical protein